MRSVCVDASVALKWVASERGSEAAIDLLESWEVGAEIWAPDHLWIEVTNGLRHKVVQSLMTATEAQTALAILSDIGIRSVGTGVVAGRSLEVSLLAALTVWDAAYIAVAEAAAAELWTADEELASKSRAILRDVHLLWDEEQRDGR